MLSRPRTGPQGYRARLAGVGMGQKAVVSNILRNYIPLFCRAAVCICTTNLPLAGVSLLRMGVGDICGTFCLI